MNGIEGENRSGEGPALPEGGTVFHFHVARSAREKYGLASELFSSSGNVVILDMRAVRLFTQRINNARRAAGDARFVRAGDLNAMGLIDEVLHYVTRLYAKQADPRAFAEALDSIDGELGREAVDAALLRFVEEFPPLDVFEGKLTAARYLDGKTGEIPNREIVFEELLHVWLSNMNPAFEPFDEFWSSTVDSLPQYGPILDSVRRFFGTRPVFGPDAQDLVSLLRSPVAAAPRSLAGQLEYIRTRWGYLLGDLLLKLLMGIDFIKEEEKLRFAFFQPGPPEVYEYANQYGEPEAFSADKDWMPRVVMLAKNTLVWLDQLSKRYSRAVTRLDQIPDEELDRLSRSGVTALWLIGVWERSGASRRIKRIMGNSEADASAYSLFDYEVARELGGEEALNALKDRAWRRGIRLASDMVPNHTGIDSRWMIEHPDRFLAYPRPFPPFPSYSFNGPNLAEDARVGIFLEEHYFTRSDAAVVFKRVDFHTGDARFIYHGNDGTHMPWNDTAQLDFLNPETREAVIRAIIRVASMFPIIRFDAAMTLTKKHFQRLWFPEPGRGGDIPSRAECGITRFEFDHAMPNEFWREVVDRVAAEAPETLLLAEAFWLLEGFFVRTLGMHRVYNSAFMNMLKTEDNAGYRLTIKNTLEFDPEVLKRFVNFMSNPDEDTAIAQFGDGDKYFGVCTLMATMPGLPMFAHGQIEGFREKYGMEFHRAYWNETPNEGLVWRHEREIFPLLKRRHLFSGVEGFLLYDLFDPAGWVNEDVFAYSNRRGAERTLVLYNNRYREAKGRIRTSVAFAVKTPEGKSLVQRQLGDGLALPDAEGVYTIFREHVSGLEYIRSCGEIRRNGLFVELAAFQYQVFLDFREVGDDSQGRWSRLAGELNGRGVPSVDEAFREMELRPVLQPFRALVNAGVCGRLISASALKGSEGAAERRKLLEDLSGGFRAFAAGVEKRAPECPVEKQTLTEFETLCGALLESPMSEMQGTLPIVWTWAVLAPFGRTTAGTAASEQAHGQAGTAAPVQANGGTGTPPDARRQIAWLEEWWLGRAARDCCLELGWDRDMAFGVSPLIALLLANGGSRLSVEGLRVLLERPEAEGFLRVNVFEGTRWFHKESLEVALRGLLLSSRIKSRQSATRALPAAVVKKDRDFLESCMASADAAGYKWDDFLRSLESPSAGNKKQPRAAPVKPGKPRGSAPGKRPPAKGAGGKRRTTK